MVQELVVCAALKENPRFSAQHPILRIHNHQGSDSFWAQQGPVVTWCIFRQAGAHIHRNASKLNLEKVKYLLF